MPNVGWGELAGVRPPGLIVQDDAQQAAVDGQAAAVGIIHEAQASELVHEVRDARPRGAHHFGQDLVTEYGDTGIRHDLMFPYPRELQKNTG